MTETSCPLCSVTYDDRTDLHVHLEVSHRKSDVVTYLVDSIEEESVDDGSRALEDDRPMSPV